MSIPLQTPPRPLPGTYFQTPAAKLHASTFQTSYPRIAKSPFAAPSPQLPRTGETAVPQKALALPAPPSSVRDLKPAERAAQTINETLVQESRFPELEHYLSPGQSSDYDIQTATPWAPFQKTKMYNLPDQIFEQYNRAQVSTSMGLFAELNHAWFAIDNALYMWDYTSPSPQLLGFESQPNNITAVSLAIPRPGVFLPTISHVIVIGTTKEVLLLGMGSETGQGGVKTFSLYQTGMSVSLKNLIVTTIATSDRTGRIFFGGDGDNDVHELVYQQEERWFSSRCAKVNHTAAGLANLGLPELPFFGQKQTETVQQLVCDDSRNLLYTLSSASAIRVFHINSDGALNLAITRTAAEIFSNIGHVISHNDTLNPRIRIVSISPVPISEASKYHLVATTATGYRIYLSVLSSSGWVQSTSVPSNMLAQHVKTPPVDPVRSSATGQTSSTPGVSFQTTNSANGPIRTLTVTRTAQRFSPGYFFCFVDKDGQQNTDTLFISTPDSGRLARPPEPGQPIRTAETATWLQLGSRAEDIGVSIPYSPPTSTPGAFSNELAVQFDKPSPEIAILTNTGVHIVRRRRLVDVFAALVRNGGGEEGLEGDIKQLIRHYGRTETLATALAVACGQGSEVAQDSRVTRVNDPEILDFARKVFIEFGGKPTVNENKFVDQSISPMDTVKPSPRHDAIAIYLARLLRSTWRSLIVKEGRGPNGGYAVLPAVPLQKLQDVQRELSSLQTFFTTNKSFIDGLSGPEALTRATTKQEEVALQGEHRAVYSLVRLVADTIEGLSFVLVLFEERVEEIVPLLPEETRPQFLQLTFEALFSSIKGYEIAKDLVKAIVNRNIAKGSNVETVAEALRRRCGSFCSAEDVVLFKAQELLKRASEAGTNTEYGRNLLNESLVLFQQVADSLPMDYLQSAVKQYVSMQFYAGSILLALRVAKEGDKADEALSWMTDGKPDSDGRQAKFEARTQCYNFVHDIINAMEDAAQSNGYLDGQPSLLETRRREAYDVISKSTDEVFLTNLYDWYLSQGWDHRLLETDSFFIVTYLERKASDNISHADLLCRYYSRANRYYDAAHVQLMLAKSNFQLPLERRIEYLSRAKANASTNTPGTGRQSRQRLLNEITDCLDVANIQDDIFQRLKADKRLQGEKRAEVLKDVGGRLLVMDELFNQYADSAGYYDLCLLIFQVADHRNASDIKNTWQLLLQKIHDGMSKSQDSQPWEAIAEQVRDLGARLRLSETTFPINLLLPLLEKYSFEHQRDKAAPHWIVDLFLDLQVPKQRLFNILEALFYNNEPPFSGSNRRVLGNDLVYLIQRWFQESARAGGPLFESEDVAIQVDQMLQMLLQIKLDDQQSQTCRMLRQRIAQILH